MHKILRSASIYRKGLMNAGRRETWERRVVLETPEGCVLEQQPLLFPLIGEEHPYYPAWFYSEHDSLSELGVKNPVTGGQADVGAGVASGRGGISPLPR